MSMAIKHQLQQSIYYLLKHNRDGSFETQGARKSVLFQAAADIVEGGFKLRNIQGIKQKHIYHLNKMWQENKLSNGTIKNRNAHLRWLCEKLGKANLVPSNDELGVGRRQYSNNQHNEALELADIDQSKITSPYIQVSIHLQRYLGLRREESIKVKLHTSDKGDYLDLQESWCKGGRARRVPIRTQAARYWIEEGKKLLAHSEQALIPEDKNYIQHRRTYDRQTMAAGIKGKHRHGLRHAYAQGRYQELTGWACPKAGGPTSRDLTQEQKAIDKAARLCISHELGHSRESISVIYCGR